MNASKAFLGERHALETTVVSSQRKPSVTVQALRQKFFAAVPIGCYQPTIGSDSRPRRK
jgi:hypothetical protein